MLLASCLVYAEDKAADAERPKTFKRLIPADVLRGREIKFSIFFNFQGTSTRQSIAVHHRATNCREAERSQMVFKIVLKT